MKPEFWDRLKAIYVEEDGVDTYFLKEEPDLKVILNDLEKALMNQYEIEDPLGRGGAGIVIKLWDKILEIHRALKIPRPIKEELIDTLTNEMGFLKSIDLDTIISIYNLGELDVNLSGIRSTKFPFFVMQFIDGAENLQSKLDKLIDLDIDRKELKKNLKWLVDKLILIAKAIDHLHTNDIVHFDIKPGNILINKYDKPIISDLGFAKKKIASDNKVVIGFTFFYAHPDLKLSYSTMSDKNRVKKEISFKEIDKIWDIYAFGKTILELLSTINMEYSDKVFLEYDFIYLHLLACRMLDGRNISQTELESRQDRLRLSDKKVILFSENYQDLDANELKEISYKKISEIVIDLAKLQSTDYFQQNILELQIYPIKKIHISDSSPAAFTKRVKRTIEHPLFRRLNEVAQLDLIDTIYPTATHTRFEHSIGVFRNCCLYINSLFNDKYNPLFRQLVNEEDLKAILFISLIHDLGHYPFAHEIEETSKIKELNHEEILKKLLLSPVKDNYGNTLKDILEDENFGWGVKIDRIGKILEINKSKLIDLFPSVNIKDKMLSSIIDGPIDVDKIDYLIRDSQNAFLKYGQLIDIERLISNLTIVTDKDNGKIQFTVGTYEKGQAAAESVIFARYLLYNSLYWHHTARSIRTMLTTALYTALEKPVDGRKIAFHDDLLLKIINYDEKEIFNCNSLLSFFYKHANSSGKEIISLIKNRNYYKRILTIHHNTKGQNDRIIIDDFRDAINNNRKQFNEKLQAIIKEKYMNIISAMDPQLKVSTLSRDITDRTLLMLEKPNMIICDAPKPSLGINGKAPRLIPEPQRLQHNYINRRDVGNMVSFVWEDIYLKLMNIAAKGRIFCHPEIRNNIMAAMNPKILQLSLEEALKSLK